MFSLAYVILPFSDRSPADAITASLARFERGRRGDVPDEWLRFEDESAEVRAVHEASLTFIKGQGLQTIGHDAGYLNIRAVMAEMDRRDTREWSVRFADLEPDLSRFAERFLTPFDRHPVTEGFGFWRNPLGRWDWWELGGRFDGVITGQPKRDARARTDVSSGPNLGRDLLNSIEEALTDALNQPLFEEIDVRTDENVEIVTRLLHDLNGDTDQLPGVLVLPPNADNDQRRWIANWPSLGPPDALAALDLSTSASWREVVQATYERFSDHWAAGVAFHH